jgi:hypothetical protein
VGSRVEIGGYMVVLSDGTIACGYQNGMKLYAYLGPAINRAGSGGTVYRIWHDRYGMCAERVHGPPVQPSREENDQ